MYCRIINFTLLAPSLWVMINQFKSQNNNLTIVKLADNKGVIIETFDSQALAGKNTTILLALQSLNAQAMAKVLVEEGSKLA